MTEMKNTTSKDLERKLKTERVQVCLNCKRLTKCDNIGRFEECEDFLEINSKRAMIIVSLDDYAKLELEVNGKMAMVIVRMDESSELESSR